MSVTTEHEFQSMRNYATQSRHKLLSKHEERRLLHDYRHKKDLNARDTLIKQNQLLVIKVANKYSNLNIPINDLIDEGNIGLMKAIEKFDLSRTTKFSTYAVWWIRQSITRAIGNKNRIVRIPIHVSDKLNKIYKCNEKYYIKNGKRLDEIDLEEYFNVHEIELYLNNIDDCDMQTNSEHVYMLDSFYNINGGDLLRCNFYKKYSDKLSNKKLMNYHREVDLKTITDKLFKEAKLTKKEIDIIKYRFGLVDGVERKLAEVGEIFGYCRERVRQIQKEAFDKIRKLGYNGIEELLNGN